MNDSTSKVMPNIIACIFCSYSLECMGLLCVVHQSNENLISYRLVLYTKNVGFSARHIISRTETRNYVGQFSVHFLESDKMFGYWLSFYVNRLERTHLVILAELLPKKPTLISILNILGLMLFNL